MFHEIIFSKNNFYEYEKWKYFFMQNGWFYAKSRFPILKFRACQNNNSELALIEWATQTIPLDFMLSFIRLAITINNNHPYPGSMSGSR